jgi:hypothetical protein
MREFRVLFCRHSLGSEASERQLNARPSALLTPATMLSPPALAAVASVAWVGKVGFGPAQALDLLWPSRL